MLAQLPLFDLAEATMPSVAAFVPMTLAVAPVEVQALPETDAIDRIAKAKAVLRWLMLSYRTAFNFSGGKDSTCLVGLALSVAAEIVAAHESVCPFAIFTADTLVENPSVHAVTRRELAKMCAWIRHHNLPGSVHVASPNLAEEFAVSVIGTGSLPSTPHNKRECTTDWKTTPLSRLRKAYLGRNRVQAGQFVVTVTGIRRDESQMRAANMLARNEAPDRIVNTNADGTVAIAPLADWSWDDVFTYLGMAANGLEHTYSDCADVIRIYREAMGECVITGAADDARISRPCSARTGCWVCLMVEEDRSMDTMLSEPGNAYMRPLAQLRTFLANTLYDLDRRSWIGRTIDANGFIKFEPDGYSPAMLQELLRYALTIQFEECEAAEAAGVAPRFSIISVNALIAIDAMWSLHGFALPFTALKIYRDIAQGARFPVPDVPRFPKVPFPEPRYIHVGANWDQGDDLRYTGLRDVMLEAFGGEGCMGTRQIVSRGRTLTVMDTRNEDVFSVDTESAMLLLEFELDRLVDEWHGKNARNLAMDGHIVAGAGYRFYVSYGTIAIRPGKEGQVDSILRRTAFRERHGLAGYQYNRDSAYRRSIRRSSAESVEPAMPLEMDSSCI